MSGRPDRLLEELDAPRGGLAGLRARIELDGRRLANRRRLRTAAASLVVLVAAGFLLLPRTERPESWRPGFSPAGVRLGLLAEPSEPLTIPVEMRGELAARRVPLDTPDVVFYLIGSRAAESPPDEGAEPAE